MFGKSVLAISILSLVICSCKTDSCRTNLAEETQVEYAIDSNINEIYLSDNVNLVYYQSDTARIYVRTSKSWQAGVIVEQQGDSLFLRNDNPCRMINDWKSEIIVELHLPKFSYLQHSGIGDVRFEDTLSTDLLKIETYDASGDHFILLNQGELQIIQHFDPSTFETAGNFDRLYIFSGGHGMFNTSNSKVKDVHVHQDGTGDMRIQATEKLKVEMRSVGNVYYSGNPDSVEIIGEGTGGVFKQ